MTRPHTFFAAMRDHGPFGWGNAGEPSDTRDGIIDTLTESFRDDTMAADLTTVQVWHFTADAPPRDVTEDILTEAGAWLSSKFTAEDFPGPFLAWANSDVQDSLADITARSWAAEQHDLTRSAA